MMDRAALTPERSSVNEVTWLRRHFVVMSSLLTKAKYRLCHVTLSTAAELADVRAARLFITVKTVITIIYGRPLQVESQLCEVF